MLFQVCKTLLLPVVKPTGERLQSLAESTLVSVDKSAAEHVKNSIVVRTLYSKICETHVYLSVYEQCTIC